MRRDVRVLVVDDSPLCRAAVRLALEEVAGFELIGSAALEAELEVVDVIVEALSTVGLDDLTLDITLAPLAGMLMDQYSVPESDRAVVETALAVKDSAKLAGLSDDIQAVFEKMIAAAGQADSAMKTLQAIDMAAGAKALVDRLAVFLERVNVEGEGLTIGG